MTQINLNNRFQLREHPDKSPVVDATFNKTHAFIYPGDELVLCNNVNLPTDAGASSMSQIKFQSVKTSIIAQKPGVFSRIFSPTFQSTRSFDLDSFFLAFNNLNAPLVPWGTDGYAPNVNFKQDRNWKLPSGVFKRAINFFTQYTASIANVQPTSLNFTVSGTTSTSIAIVDSYTNKTIGCAAWTTNLATTMALLVTSINTNTNHGSIWSPLPSFSNAIGFTASYNSGTRVLTLIPPPNIGAALNGIYSNFYDQDSGLSIAPNFEQTWTGGVTYVAPKWDYNFYFPILFRWEYWKILAAADPDFYSSLIATITSPEGQNQFWENYSLPPGWQIKSHIELNLLVNGVATTLVNEYNLSNESNEINTYNTNSDYTAKSIKTCPVGGTPSNTPICAIYGYQDTAVYAYFTKVSNYVAGEQANLVGFMWIEPFEGGGEPVRVVASSIYPVPASSWFVDMFQPIETDVDVTLVDDNNVSIVTDNSSMGVLVTFDSSNPKEIVLLSQLDYTKINAAFPGVTQFTLYARLYNGTKLVASAVTTVGTPSITGSQYVANGATSQSYVVAGIPAGYTLQSTVLPSGWVITSTGSISGGSQTFAMTVGLNSGTILFTYVNGGNTITAGIDVYVGATKQGEEIYQQCQLVQSNPTPGPGLPVRNNPLSCPYVLKVFADAANPTVELNNDMSDFYYYGDAGITAIAIAIQKNTSNCGSGSWVTQATFTDNTYGKFFAFGTAPDFSGNPFVDDYGKKYTGIQLSWLAILNAFGAGDYRIMVTYTTILSTTNIVYSPAEYCLKQLTAYNANRTVRIETTHSGLYGAGIDNPNILIDFFTGWNSQIRIEGIFWYKNSSYNKEYNQYGDLEFNAYMPIINEQVPKFKLEVKPAPGWLDYYLATMVLQCDTCYITDYNDKNRHTFIRTPVINDSDFTPKDENWINPLAMSELNFAYGQNNLRKRND